MEINLEAEAKALDLPEAEASETIKGLTSRYRNLKDFEELCENRRKKAKSEREALDSVIYDKMIEEGMDKVDTELGSFSPKEKRLCSINKDKTEEAFVLLEEAGLGASIKRTIHYQTLNKHYGEEEFVVPEDSDVFKTWSRKTIVMRRKNVPRFD